MGKVIQKTQSSDGQVIVGHPAPTWTQSTTNGLMTDGRYSMKYWTNLNDEEMKKSLYAAEKNKKEKQRLRKKKDKEITIKRLAEYRQRSKPGAKLSLTDEQVLYLRTECKTRTVSSLCKELRIGRTVADNAIKGITFKHLDIIIKPQW